MNVFSATARLGKDADTRYMANGDPVIGCTAAITSGYGEKAVTTWVNLSMFGKRFEKVAPYLKKGGQVAISGELTNREYTDKDGNKRFSLDLRINDLTLIGGRPDTGDKPKPERKDDRGMVLREPGSDFDESEEIPF